MRYSGFALARELGSLLAGGVAPAFSAWLVTSQGGQPWGVALYMIGMCLITAFAVYSGPETYRLDLHADNVDP